MGSHHTISIPYRIVLYGTIVKYHFPFTSVSADLQNTTDATVRDFYAVFALKDAEGKLLYVTSCQPSCAGIKLGSSIKDSSTANSIVPAMAEAIACFIVEAE